MSKNIKIGFVSIYIGIFLLFATIFVGTIYTHNTIKRELLGIGQHYENEMLSVRQEWKILVERLRQEIIASRVEFNKNANTTLQKLDVIIQNLEK